MYAGVYCIVVCIMYKEYHYFRFFLFQISKKKFIAGQLYLLHLKLRLKCFFGDPKIDHAVY